MVEIVYEESGANREETERTNKNIMILDMILLISELKYNIL